jgi:hypothetical protein
VSSHFNEENMGGRKYDGALGHLRRNHYLPRFDDVEIRHPDECILPDDQAHRWVLSSDASDELIRRQWDLVAAAIREKPVCAPQALPEPLKVRIVTAGPPETYSALRVVQKVMFEGMFRDERFLRGDISGDRILNILGRLLNGNKWLSGDYKAATDNLVAELSARIVDRIAQRTEMPDIYQRLLLRALTGHFYTYDMAFDPKYSIWAPLRRQLRGQLMGSPVSFPVLCIANFALIWASVFPGSDFCDVPCIVNGDDCLFQCDESQRQSWAGYADAVGLTPSVGKTYFSDRFMVINSELYTVETVMTRKGESYTYVPYVNMGLLMGLKRSGEREILCEVMDFYLIIIGVCCCVLVKGWYGLMWTKLID